MRFSVSLFRALCTRPATSEELKELNTGPCAATVEALLFYAATTHDPEREAPDWSAERLLNYMAVQSKNAQTIVLDKNQTGVAALPFVAFISQGSETIKNRLIQEPSVDLVLIRRAHHGDTEAIRAMAWNYKKGAPNFVQDNGLSQAWLRHAAVGGDTRSMLLLAFDQLAEKHLPEAWAWALLCKDLEEKDAQTKQLAQRLLHVVEAQALRQERTQGEALALRYIQEHVDWLEHTRKIPEGKNIPAPERQQ